jgi:hypothetical protein
MLLKKSRTILFIFAVALTLAKISKKKKTGIHLCHAKVLHNRTRVDQVC